MTTPEITPSARAETAAQRWRAVVHAQRTATWDHGEFYALAGELVDTLRSLESLTHVLQRQVGAYGEGRVLRDDAGLDPAARLVEACDHLARTMRLLASVERAANQSWSAIGHIGTEEHRP